ncbi:hypothetical protein PoB_000379700 [Plakobranchus ocellatus]|uniref:Mutator-like transposase domain-containing protein n=1 Tax=Plakobranchus ocellatus TaxID=259542 RepID=A0AAV3Y4B9_9GAST|nr:hypothetical protein PoB_000379700 [Plakobranchus ocellatus]
MRRIGGRHADLETFCGVMDLPPPVGDNSFNLINQTMLKAAETIQDKSMANEAKNEFILADQNEDDVHRNVDVLVDGTWMTRGHSSKIGVTTVIGCETGKVLDTNTLSKICKSCEHWEKRDKDSEEYRKWQAEHKSNCTANHAGSSGYMESESAVQMFGRSISKYQLRYTRFIGDGDTNSFKKVFESTPYGQEYPVEKSQPKSELEGNKTS